MWDADTMQPIVPHSPHPSGITCTWLPYRYIDFNVHDTSRKHTAFFCYIKIPLVHPYGDESNRYMGVWDLFAVLAAIESVATLHPATGNVTVDKDPLMPLFPITEKKSSLGQRQRHADIEYHDQYAFF